MKKHSHILTLCILLVFFVKVVAQTGTFYSPDKELSNSLINSIYQDHRNYIWIATEDGLNKFDGVKFTVYKNKSGDPKTIKNNYVRALLEDSQNRFWVGCVNGLHLYDRAEDSFTEVELFSGSIKINPHITSIIESKNSEIWITTSGQGIIRIKNESKEYRVDTQLSNMLCSKFLTVVFQDSKQNLWIGSENQGLNMFSPKTRKVITFDAPQRIGSNHISSICEDSKGRIFVGTLTGGLFRLNSSTMKFEQVLYSTASSLLPVKSIILDNQNRLLVGISGMGLKFYNEKTNTLQDFPLPSAPFDFSKMKVHAILQDNAGNIWTGLYQKGVFLAPNTPNKFNYIGNKSFDRNIIGSSCVMSILMDKDKNLWVGTDNDGLYKVNSNRKSIHFAHQDNSNSVSSTITSMVEDNNGVLWLGSFLNGLAHFDKQTGRCTNFKINLNQSSISSSNNKVICMAKDAKNQLWIGTNGAGVFIFNIATQTFTDQYSQEGKGIHQLPNNWVTSILCDKDGMMWLGSYKGICGIDSRTGKVQQYFDNPKVLPGNIVYAINEDRAGNLWIGTTEGLACFNKKTRKSTIYTTENGLSSNVICGIQEDEKRNIWLSTHSGISKYSIEKNKFLNYYSYDGLQGNEFSKGASFKTTEGEILFGGIGGVTLFKPSKISNQAAPLKLNLVGMKLLDKPVIKGQKSGSHTIIDKFISDVNTIYLSYKDNMFSLEFSTFNFGSLERVYYRYKIEGLNSNWISTEQGVNKISFTNLNYGTYKLKVMACMDDNLSEIKELEIVIFPPWYLSWWAKLFYFLLLMLSVYSAYKFASNRLKNKRELLNLEHAKQLNEAKLQFFINISHEIRTPMTLIISPLEKLISENADSEKKKVYQMMYRNSQRILRLINQLMDIRKIDKGLMFLKFSETDMVGFIDDLMQTFEYQANKRNIRFVFSHADTPVIAWIDENNFDKVLLNILSNAFKFTPENGEICVTLRTATDENEKEELRNFVEIIVSDTGIGLEEEKIERIFERFYQIDNDQTKSNFGTGIGLHLALSLVQLQHGTLVARNKADGNGSEFVVRLPLGNAHLENAEMGTASLQPRVKTEPTELEVQDFYELKDEETPKVKSKTNYRILVVEDEDEIRQYIRTELSDKYKIFECSNGKDALEFILKEKPHLVISDIMMPEMDGITLCRKIKSNVNINHIPIVLLTAKSTDEEKAEGYDIGADAYVVKPFNVELLKKRVANLIENRERLVVKLSDSDKNQLLIKPIEMRPSDDILLEKIMKIINENIAESDLNVEMLASGVGMSRVHIHRKLKELTNQSARDFIKTIRLKKAAELFSNPKLNISEVAYALGFSNLSHFSNSFREFYGMSPKEYQNKVSKDKPKE